jgi:hypothetical protein
VFQNSGKKSIFPFYEVFAKLVFLLSRKPQTSHAFFMNLKRNIAAVKIQYPFLIHQRALLPSQCRDIINSKLDFLTAYFLHIVVTLAEKPGLVLAWTSGLKVP